MDDLEKQGNFLVTMWNVYLQFHLENILGYCITITPNKTIDMNYKIVYQWKQNDQPKW